VNSEWLKPELCKEWAKQIGWSGDSFREAFIKPIVFGVAKAARESANAYESSNAMASEIGKFTEGSESSHYEPQSKFAKKKELEELVFLDLGAGEGYLGRWLCKKGAKYFAIDQSPSLVQFGLNLAKTVNRGNYFACVADIQEIMNGTKLEELNWNSNPVHTFEIPKLNVIMCHAALEHLQDQEEFFKYISRLLKERSQNGVFILTTLIPEYFQPRSKFKIGTLGNSFLPDRKFRLGTTGFDVHLKLLTLDRLSHFFAKAGLRVVESVTLDCQSYPKSMLTRFIKEGFNEDCHAPGPFVAHTLVSNS
jgi:2-polyprenyl-3-methyl-5-hydroxy-6-metoxy-1,4-benzoquinol methylase